MTLTSAPGLPADSLADEPHFAHANSGLGGPVFVAGGGHSGDMALHPAGPHTPSVAASAGAFFRSLPDWRSVEAMVGSFERDAGDISQTIFLGSDATKDGGDVQVHALPGDDAVDQAALPEPLWASLGGVSLSEGTGAVGASAVVGGGAVASSAHLSSWVGWMAGGLAAFAVGTGLETRKNEEVERDPSPEQDPDDVPEEAVVSEDAEAVSDDAVDDSLDASSDKSSPSSLSVWHAEVTPPAEPFAGHPVL